MCATAADRITPVPMAPPRTPGRTRTPVPTSAPSDVRVMLDSLPVPLRVTAGDQSEGGIAFEAELPWLAVGTGLNVQLPSGVEQTGRIHSFEMGVTPTGSARLRIFAEISPRGCLPTEALARRASRPGETRRARSSVWRLACVVGTFIGAYAGWPEPALRSLVDVADVAALFAQVAALFAVGT
jgi:hypothetical protein